MRHADAHDTAFLRMRTGQGESAVCNCPCQGERSRNLRIQDIAPECVVAPFYRLLAACDRVGTRRQLTAQSTRSSVTASTRSRKPDAQHSHRTTIAIEQERTKVDGSHARVATSYRRSEIRLLVEVWSVDTRAWSIASDHIRFSMVAAVIDH